MTFSFIHTITDSSTSTATPLATATTSAYTTTPSIIQTTHVNNGTSAGYSDGVNSPDSSTNSASSSNQPNVNDISNHHKFNKKTKKEYEKRVCDAKNAITMHVRQLKLKLNGNLNNNKNRRGARYLKKKEMDELVKTYAVAYDVEPGEFNISSIYRRISRGSSEFVSCPKGRGSKSPMAVAEPILAEIIKARAKSNNPVSIGECITLGNEMIEGTDIEKEVHRFTDTRTKLSRSDENERRTLGYAWSSNFMKRNNLNSEKKVLY